MKKRYIKTYAAKGLLECKMSLHIGKATVTVLFTGGSMGATGVISAKYVTANTALQTLIEGSSQFHSGRVYLHKREEIANQSTPAAHDTGTPPTNNSENESEDNRPGTESRHTDGRDTGMYE